jgi:hypothetical protein
MKFLKILKMEELSKALVPKTVNRCRMYSLSEAFSYRRIRQMAPQFSSNIRQQIAALHNTRSCQQMALLFNIRQFTESTAIQFLIKNFSCM